MSESTLCLTDYDIISQFRRQLQDQACRHTNSLHAFPLLQMLSAEFDSMQLLALARIYLHADQTKL